MTTPSKTKKKVILKSTPNEFRAKNPNVRVTKPKFSKTDPTDLGEYMFLKVSDIMIDPIYQREIRKSRIKNISNHFNWAVFDPIRINMREDGKFYCYDGQHRLNAAILAGMTEIPCVVRMGMSLLEESRAYIASNVNASKSATAHQRWKAGLLDPTTIFYKADRICKRVGVKVTETGGPRHATCAIRLYELYRDDPRAFEVAMTVAAEVCTNHTITEQIICGLWNIQHSKLYDMSGLDPKGTELKAAFIKVGGARLHEGAKNFTLAKLGARGRGGRFTWMEGLMTEVNKHFNRRKGDVRFPFTIGTKE